MNHLSLRAVLQVCSAENGEITNLDLDQDDIEAFNQYMSFRQKGGRWQVKGGAWKRWKDVTQYLTGTMCGFRNGDNTDFRRDNLKPALFSWREKQKWT